jgi:Protein of unknown function (DUF1348)
MRGARSSISLARAEGWTALFLPGDGRNRIAVRFAYEWHDDSGSWFRSYGNENCWAHRF